MIRKSVRHRIYKDLLEQYLKAIASSTDYTGLCWCLSIVLNKYSDEELKDNLQAINSFPELISQQPNTWWNNDAYLGTLTGDTSSYFWWSTSNTEARINAINIAIEKSKRKTKS